MDRPLTVDARADGTSLLDALRKGRTYTEIDAIASGALLEFTARTADENVEQGGVLRSGGSATFHARAAQVDGASTLAFRNGEEIKRATGTALDFESAETGAFRIEIHVAGAPGAPPVPWVISNPIYRFTPGVPVPPAPRLPVHSLQDAAWRVEKSDRSEGAAKLAGRGEVGFAYRLGGGAPASQFAALVADLPRNVPEFGGISFTVQGSAPTRLSVQLRFTDDDNARWRKSVYVDREPRALHVAVDSLHRADGPQQRPAIRRVTSLLFVVDLTNARPGDAGTLTLRDVSLTRRAPSAIPLA
jgi:hypothetical protein